jgi:hypothetical protein
MIRLKESAQCQQICASSLSCLHDKFLHERGLFAQSPASQSSVRQLLASALSGNIVKIREESDPHVVTGLVLHTLKSMPSPVLCDVHRLVMETELGSDPFLNKEAVVFLLQHMPQEKLDLLSVLVTLLSRIASNAQEAQMLSQRGLGAGGMDSSSYSSASNALSFFLAPYLCRLPNTAFMSIKHKECLPKARALLAFLVDTPGVFSGVKSLGAGADHKDNADTGVKATGSKADGSMAVGGLAEAKDGSGDYFRAESKQTTKAAVASSSSSSGRKPTGVGKDALGGAQAKGMTTRTTPPPLVLGGASEVWQGQGDELKEVAQIERERERDRDRDRDREKTRDRDRDLDQERERARDLERERRAERDRAYSLVEIRETEGRDAWSARMQHLQFSQSQDWAVLQALVLDLVVAFAHAGGYREHKRSASVSPVSAFASASAAPSSSSSSSTSAAAAGGATATSSSRVAGAKGTDRSARRRLVAECRSLRQQIYFFEQTFSQQHRRLPRNDERGSMAPAYSRYKEVKRFVRDQAAVDIQKAWRGFHCRRLGGFGAAPMAAGGGGPGRGEPRRKGQRISVDSSDAAASIGIDAMSIGISRVGPAQPFVHAPALAPAPVATVLPLDVLQQCRSLQQEKREIKRRLKRFDEDFLRDHGRAPKKADKEVMRPVYQQYHDIKGRLDAMRRDIEASYGAFPAEADGDEGAFYTSEEEGGASVSSSDRLSSLPALQSRPLAAASSASVSPAAAAAAPLPAVALGGEGAGVGAQHEQPSLAQLHEEKRTLHAHLKAYEREFQRTHGRQVMHQEDILPVSAEYRRYKDLKAWIKENT